MRVCTARDLLSLSLSLSFFFGLFTLVSPLVFVIILFLVVARDTQQPSLVTLPCPEIRETINKMTSKPVEI